MKIIRSAISVIFCITILTTTYLKSDTTITVTKNNSITKPITAYLYPTKLVQGTKTNTKYGQSTAVTPATDATTRHFTFKDITGKLTHTNQKLLVNVLKSIDSGKPTFYSAAINTNGKTSFNVVTIKNKSGKVSGIKITGGTTLGTTTPPAKSTVPTNISIANTTKSKLLVVFDKVHTTFPNIPASAPKSSQWVTVTSIDPGKTINIIRGATTKVNGISKPNIDTQHVTNYVSGTDIKSIIAATPKPITAKISL
ncbi:hypothetical protein HN446_00770 [bacterium]|jgi:hypothetical protein|nr:hypothetical protein [bacterium]